MSAEIRKKDLRARDYLGHIVEACDRIVQYISDLTHQEFLENPLVQDAVLRNIEVIGEATNQLLESNPGFEQQYAEIPWVDLYGMRNRIAHGYFFINYEIVWQVCQRRVPELRVQIAAILQTQVQPI